MKELDPIWEAFKDVSIVCRSFLEVWWMAVKREQIWAIGFNGMIEIRACTSPPKPIRTEYEKDSIITQMEAYETATGSFRVRRVKVPRKLQLKNVIHTGGRPLTSIPYHTFWRLIHLHIPNGECMKLTKLQATAVLRKNIPNYD